MSDITILDTPARHQAHVHAEHAQCPDCLGSGGWYRYEPAMEPAPGLLYLSCLECRGTGKSEPASA